MAASDSTEPRDQRKEIRWTARELEEITEAARGTGLSVSAWVRLVCLRAARRASEGP